MTELIIQYVFVYVFNSQESDHPCQYSKHVNMYSLYTHNICSCHFSVFLAGNDEKCSVIGHIKPKVGMQSNILHHCHQILY